MQAQAYVPTGMNSIHADLGRYAMLKYNSPLHPFNTTVSRIHCQSILYIWCKAEANENANKGGKTTDDSDS